MAINESVVSKSKGPALRIISSITPPSVTCNCFYSYYCCYTVSSFFSTLTALRCPSDVDSSSTGLHKNFNSQDFKFKALVAAGVLLIKDQGG